MKKNLAFFLVGIVFGASIIFALYNLGTPPLTAEQQILDDVIQEWTAPADTSQSSKAFFLKLVNARVGNIPDTVRSLARMVEEKYKVPKGVVLAQWILESRWGLADLGANNYFGHTYLATKQYCKQPQFVTKVDKKYVHGVAIRVNVRFASYNNIAECFDVHGQYLSGSRLYRDAFKTTSLEMFVRLLSKHYAEDPDYAIKLITLMRRYKL